jgi:hypothetical protein
MTRAQLLWTIVAGDGLFATLLFAGVVLVLRFYDWWNFERLVKRNAANEEMKRHLGSVEPRDGDKP